MNATFVNAIKRFEGFSATAKWDYAQHSNGYGTKALHSGENISRAEAERRLQDELNSAQVLVERFAPGLPSGTKAALTSLTFNAGTKWMSSGLGAAVRSGDLDAARNLFLQYNKAGNEVLPGLVTRRLEEVTWFDSDANSTMADAAIGHAVDQNESNAPHATVASIEPTKGLDALQFPWTTTFAATAQLENWQNLLLLMDDGQKVVSEPGEIAIASSAAGTSLEGPKNDSPDDWQTELNVAVGSKVLAA